MSSPSSSPSFPRILVVGAGAIGCALARELAGRGAAPPVLDRAAPGMEASHAAAGLIAPQAEGLPAGPLLDLAIASRELYPSWSRELAAETGIDVGWRRIGVLRCDLEGGMDFSRFRGDPALPLSASPSFEEAGPERISELTLGLASGAARRALWFPDDGILDPRRLTHALFASAANRGARFVSGAAARRFLVEGGRCRGVETDRGVFEADVVVDAAGAWAAFDPESAPVPVRPVRGQIVDLRPGPPLLPVAIQSADAYLVPRPDGSLLVGSTEEEAGFEKRVTAEGVSGLLAAAARLVPSLSRATFAGAWAGLRPGSPDGAPILGPSGVAGLLLATGHFRNGILLAPITARLVADAALGALPPELAPFSVARFGPAPSPNGPIGHAGADPAFRLESR